MENSFNGFLGTYTHRKRVQSSTVIFPGTSPVSATILYSPSSIL